MQFSVAVVFAVLVANVSLGANGFSPAHRSLPSVPLVVLRSSATEEKLEETKVGMILILSFMIFNFLIHRLTNPCILTIFSVHRNL